MRLAAKPGFAEAERFEEYGAEQWFGVRAPAVPSDGARASRSTPGLSAYTAGHGMPHQ